MQCRMFKINYNQIHHKVSNDFDQSAETTIATPCSYGMEKVHINDMKHLTRESISLTRAAIHMTAMTLKTLIMI